MFEYRLIVNPNLRCDACTYAKIKHRSKPRCETPKGCPIEDIAPNKKLSDLVDALIKAFGAQRASKSSMIMDRVLDKYGLLDEPELVLELYQIWMKFLEKNSR